MSLSIKDLRQVESDQPPRVLIYGPPGIGKTTLASEWPSPIFLQAEDGTPAGLSLTSFGQLRSYNEVMEALAVLYTEKHNHKTVVLDSLDKLEPMIWAKVCEDNQVPNIETLTYGKGYVLTDSVWRELLDGFTALRNDKNMHIVYIAHSVVGRVDDPMTASYSQYDIRLHRRAVGIVQSEVDAILFINQDVTLKMNDPTGKSKSGPGARVRADGGGNRWIYCQPRPSYIAKNRYDLPDKIQYERGKGFAELGTHFPGMETPPNKKAAKAAA